MQLAVQSIPIKQNEPNFSLSRREWWQTGVRRALPDLLRLNRYERRAAARRDRAIRALTQSKD
jgi:hypothetical protein